MVLVIFLLAYIVRRKLDTSESYVGDGLWRYWFQPGSRIQAGKESATWMGLLLVAVPALLLLLAEAWLNNTEWRMVGYPVEFLVLVLAMGIPGWASSLRAYSEAWSRGDMQAAWHHVKDLLPADERGAAASPDDMHLSLSRAFLRAVFERFFVIAFWYAVGGIGMAILARGITALRYQWPQAAARPRYATLAEAVNWLPARLLAFTFGIAGDLSGWLREARQGPARPALPADRVLMVAANGALTGYALDPARFSRLHPDEWTGFGGRSLNAVRDLLNRSMLVWICAMALLVIAGWA